MTADSDHYAMKDAYKLGWYEAKKEANDEIELLRAELRRLRDVVSDIDAAIIDEVLQSSTVNNLPSKARRE